MMRSLAVLLSLAAFSMGQFVSPPILTLGSPSNTTVCGSVSISWDWTGSNLGTTIVVTNSVPENAISTSMPVPPQPYAGKIGETIDLMSGGFIWQQAAVPGGWYAFLVYDQPVGGSVYRQSTSFFVDGGVTPTCTLVIETGTVGRGPTSDGFPTATQAPTQAPGGSIPSDGGEPSQSGGGINAGVIAGVVLGALAGIAIAGVLFFFLCRRRGRGFIRASRAFGKLDAEAKGNAAKSGHGRWGGLGSVDVTTAANQANAAAAAGAVAGAAAQKDFPFSSSANGGSTAAQSRITLGDEKVENEDENPFREPTVPSLHSHPSETLITEESRVASPISRTTSPRPAPPPPPARRGSVLSSSSSSQDHGSAPNSPPLTAQRGPRGPPPPITPRANRTNTGPKTPTLSPRTRTASLKEFVDQNQGYAMAAYSVNGSGQDEQARYSRLSNMPALAHAVPTAIITTPRPPSTIGLPLTQPRRKPAPVYDIEMKGKSEGESSASTSTSGLGLSMGGSTSGSNVSTTALGNATGNGAALGSGTGIGLAADGDGPVHYLIPDLPPPQPKGR